MPVLAKHAINPATFEETSFDAAARQRPLCGRGREARPQRDAQAQSRLLGARSCRSTAASGISTRSASTFTAMPTRISRPSRKDCSTCARSTIRAAGRPAYDFPAVRDGRIVKEALPDRPAEGHVRLRVQHAAADLRRHPRARGDRAAVRLRMGQPQFLLRPLPAHRELFRRLGAFGARPAADARERALLAPFPMRCAPTCSTAPGRRRSPTAPGATATRSSARSTLFDAAGFELAEPSCATARTRQAVRLRDLVTTQGPGAAGARFRAPPQARRHRGARARWSTPCNTTGAASTFDFDMMQVPLGPVALAGQRAGLLLGLGRRRRSMARRNYMGVKSRGDRRHDRGPAQGARAATISSPPCARSIAC